MASTADIKKYTLISSDDVRIPVTEEIIKQNDIWTPLLDCLDEEIPIKDITGKVLKKVILFCERFVKDPPYDVEDTEVRNNLRSDSRVANFFHQMKSRELREITLAASYLNNQRLIDASLFHIHRNLEDKSVDEIRTALKIECDFTKEELDSFNQKPRCYFTDEHGDALFVGHNHVVNVVNINGVHA